MAGRPSDITTIVSYRDDDPAQPVTVADRVVGSMYLHGYLEPAALAAGVTKETVYAWIRAAGAARLRLAAEPATAENTTEHERACIEFSDAVDAATARWTSRMLQLADRLAEGGIEFEEVHTETVNGQEVKKKVVVKKTQPDGAMIRWRLARRDPKKYGDRLALTDADGGPALSLDERGQALLELLKKFQEQDDDLEQAARCGVYPRRDSQEPRGRVCTRERGHRGKHRYELLADG